MILFSLNTNPDMDPEWIRIDPKWIRVDPNPEMNPK